ncbi:MAG: metallophosphoesterase [Lachnospiraceae bacterium]|nr:metallophosphoesterase [Lachnospiraceae bacterium]
MFVLVIICFAGVFAATGYSLFRLFKFYKAVINKPGWIYWLVQLLLVGNMFISAMNQHLVQNPVLTGIMQFFAAAEFIIILYSAIVFLLRDLIRLLVTLVLRLKRGKTADNSAGEKPLKALYGNRFTVILLCLLFILSVYGYISMGIIHEKEYELHISKHAETDRMTAAVLTDLHVGTGVWVADIPELVDKVNAMNCDIILVVGDVVDNNTPDSAYDMIRKEFARFDAEHGVIFTFGNHDKSGSPMLEKALSDAGVRILKDEMIKIDGINFVGRDDVSRGKIKELSEYDIDYDEPVIVLNHQPNRLASLTDADLVLSGHTHGEQFPLCYFLNMTSNDNIYGIKKFENMTSLVTSGAGGWGFRFKCPSFSEILKLTISFE